MYILVVEVKPVSVAFYSGVIPVDRFCNHTYIVSRSTYVVLTPCSMIDFVGSLDVDPPAVSPPRSL